MAKVPAAEVKKTDSSIDYLSLPFEVYYSGPVDVTNYEFKSDVKVNRFEDVKAVHMEQGNSWGSNFFCSTNNGPELYCCLINGHDEVEPPWLVLEEEDNIDFNYGCDYAVVIEGDEIKFVTLSDDQEDEESDDYLDVDSMDYCCRYAFQAYHIGDASPDFIILDAEESRIKIDLDGFALDDEGNRIESQRVINVDELDDEKYHDYERRELYEVKAEWVKGLLEEDFPEDQKLRLSWHTE